MFTQTHITHDGRAFFALSRPDRYRKRRPVSLPRFVMFTNDGTRAVSLVEPFDARLPR